jgi:hypothetical protein
LTKSVGSTVARECSVTPAAFPGDLPTEPPGRNERCSVGLGAELDLDHAQPCQCTGVHVDFGDVPGRAIERHSVSRLVDPSPDRVRPQRLCLLGCDPDVDLGSRDAPSCLHRERRLSRCDPDPNLHSVVLGEVTLTKVDASTKQAGRRPLGHDELPFDLHRHLISM